MVVVISETEKVVVRSKNRASGASGDGHDEMGGEAI
jgi:hypothetical protein